MGAERDDPADAPRRAIFRKRDRVQRRAEFKRIQSRGQRLHTRSFIVILLPRSDTRNRVGITVTKKIGTAVRRNRVKRLVREVFRQHRELFPRGCDVVFIAKRGAPDLDFRAVHQQVSGLRGAMRKLARKAAAQPARQAAPGRDHDTTTGTDSTAGAPGATRGGDPGARSQHGSSAPTRKRRTRKGRA